MTCNSLDLTISDVLSDPLIGAVMRADHVDRQRFESLLRAKSRHRAVAKEVSPASLPRMAAAVRSLCCGAG